MSARLACIGLALCDECGHPAGEHAEGYICTHWLGDECGWYGVCPCVRYSEHPQTCQLTPNPIRLGGEDAA